MRNADALLHIGDINAANMIYHHVVRQAAPAVAAATRYDPEIDNLVAMMCAAGKRGVALEALSALLKNDRLNSDDHSAVRDLHRMVEHGAAQFGVRGAGAGTIYCCQRCGLLTFNVARRCARCAFLASSINEFAQCILLSSAHLDLNLVIALSARVPSGEAISDIIEDYPSAVESVLTTENLSYAFDEYLQECSEVRVEWLDSIDDVTACARCGSPPHWSQAFECRECQGPIQLPPLLRGALSAHRFAILLADLVVLDPDSRAKAMICALADARDTAFLEGEQPSMEAREAFCQYWAGDRTVWNWDLDFCIKFTDGELHSFHHKATPDGAMESKARKIARELKATMFWMHAALGV